ncbi:MAG: alpha/beta hydrolase [Novosphingobium sp.]|nr:alpha/beta hydrolase [Novosphingobium sp.]
MSEPAPVSRTTPAAPEWFANALATRPEESWIEIDGAPIEVLAWGERGQPGILFLHGNGAHARWWSFIAPFFSAQFRCAALSWSGMGRSGWRSAYSPDIFVAEAIGVAETAGLFEASAPLIVAHSFGGLPALRLAASQPDRISGLIVVDTPLYDASTIENMPNLRLREHPLYPTRDAALERFRLTPPNKQPNDYVLDFLGSTSLIERESGWTWQFDPFLWKDAHFTPDLDMVSQVSSKFAYFYGDQSEMTGHALASSIARRNPAAAVIAIPEAGHHVMVDQPLAFIAALRSVISCW